VADLKDNKNARRLATVTEKDPKRMTKYLAAWRELKAIPDLPVGYLGGPAEG
jgi:hypothetical protein